VQASDVDAFFKQYGWRATKLSEDTWQAIFAGEHRPFIIRVTLTSDWLYFALDLASYDWQRRYPERLLEANGQMWLAKFATDTEGRLLLRADMPTEGFVYSHFSDCLGALSHYADHFSAEWK
jgi:hypothetical protein